MNAVVKSPLPGGTAFPETVCVINPEQDVDKQRKRRRMTPAERAAAEAEAVRRAALEEAEAVRRQAAEQGYREGLARAEIEFENRAAELESLAESIAQERDRFFEQIEPQVVKLSVEIAEKILRHEISIDPEAVLGMVKAALRQLRDRETVRLRINPADREMVMAGRQALTESMDGVRTIEIVEDRRVDRGGCIAESADGSIDARIASQLSEVMRVLQEAGGHDTAGSDSGSEPLLQNTEPNEHPAA